MSTIKKTLMADLRNVEYELEKEEFQVDISDRWTVRYFGILRILYHILTAEIMRMERSEKGNGSN